MAHQVPAVDHMAARERDLQEVAGTPAIDILPETPREMSRDQTQLALQLRLIANHRREPTVHRGGHR